MPIYKLHRVMDVRPSYLAHEEIDVLLLPITTLTVSPTADVLCLHNHSGRYRPDIMILT